MNESFSAVILFRVFFCSSIHPYVSSALEVEDSFVVCTIRCSCVDPVQRKLLKVFDLLETKKTPEMLLPERWCKIVRRGCIPCYPRLDSCTGSLLEEASEKCVARSLMHALFILRPEQ